MKKIKKMTLEISETLLKRMDRAIEEDGLHSRSEFLRFLIVMYTKRPASDTRNEQESNGADEDEFADVDCEFGIPVEVIEKLKKRAAEIR